MFKVAKHSWIDSDGKTTYVIRVYYRTKASKNGFAIRRFSDSETLPVTVVNFMLNAKNCETVYRSEPGNKTEIFTNHAGR